MSIAKMSRNATPCVPSFLTTARSSNHKFKLINLHNYRVALQQPPRSTSQQHTEHRYQDHLSKYSPESRFRLPTSGCFITTPAPKYFKSSSSSRILNLWCFRHLAQERSLPAIKNYVHCWIVVQTLHYCTLTLSFLTQQAQVQTSQPPQHSADTHISQWSLQQHRSTTKRSCPTEIHTMESLPVAYIIGM